MKIDGRCNQSQRITKRDKKCLKQQKQLRLLISEIEIQGDKNLSKNETVEKNSFNFFERP